MAIMYDLKLDQHAVTWEPLSKSKPYVIIPPDHKYGSQETISLKELESEEYVLFDAPGSKEYFYKLFSQVGIKPDISFRSTSLESVRSAVGCGLGFSILTMRPPSEDCYDGNKITSLEIRDKIDPTAIVMVRSAKLEVEPLHRKFIEHCSAVISE